MGIMTPIFATRDPVLTLRNPKTIIPAKMDWVKVRRYLAGEWPLEVPQPKVVYQLDDEYRELLTIASQSSIIACDTEYDTKGDTVWPGELTLVGLAFRDELGNIRGLQIKWDGYDALTTWKDIWDLFHTVPVVFWNAQADLPIISQHIGMSYPRSYKKVHDAMLAHALLYAEQPHTLESVESIYSPYNKMKHLGEYSQ